MSSSGPGNCPANSSLGFDGKCYSNCPAGWTPLENGPYCAMDCPVGFATTTDGTVASCVRPAFDREVKPMLECPPGANRQYDKCLLDCPVGTRKDFNLCVPDCPPGFVETQDGLSCQAEFVKRLTTVREACYANETRIGGRICMAPCDAGTVPLETNSELCYATVPLPMQPFFWTGDPNFKQNVGPLVSKVIFSRTQSAATCLSNFDPINGQCFAECPPNSTASATECFANCPPEFKKSVNGIAACVRPLQKRSIVKSAWQEAGSIATTVGIGIGVIFLLGLVTSVAVKKR